ncbi:MAG: transglutaminase family protein [Pseudomonadota bacterium]
MSNQLPFLHRIRVRHATEYRYHQPVTFGPHRILVRPREGHDIRIVGGRVEIDPTPTMRFLRDVYGNSTAIFTFDQPADRLRIFIESELVYIRDNPFETLVDPAARFFPFQYAPEEQVELVPYRLPSYPYDAATLVEWLQGLYEPGQRIETVELLERLNRHIFRSFRYASRETAGVQLPSETIARGSGSCRDFAVLMMEAARQWGFAARFVSGYIQMGEGQHGATHAWTEVYLPGAGWQGFDPTNDKLAGREHIAVAVARAQEKAMPVSGSWFGPAEAFAGMDVSVEVARY